MKRHCVLDVIILLQFKYSYSGYDYGDQSVERQMDYGDVIYVNDYSSSNSDTASNDYGPIPYDNDNDGDTSNNVNYLTYENEGKENRLSNHASFDRYGDGRDAFVASKFS